MPTYQSWFRPWLDHRGPWEAWPFTADERAALTATIAAAAAQARQTLDARYGAEARAFGAVELIERLARMELAADVLCRTALAIAAVDYYQARATMPRPRTGGSTNPVHRKLWDGLRPYLMGRLQQGVAANAADSLLARAVFERLADQWVPVERIARRLKRQFDDTGLFSAVEVALDVRPPLAGGRAWLHEETRRTLSAIKARLGERVPVLVELLRDPGESPTAAQVVVVYRVDESDTGWLSLACYDPGRGAEPLGLRLHPAADELVIYPLRDDEAGEDEAGDDEVGNDEVGDRDSRVAPKGLRLFRAREAAPPLFGLRRMLRFIWPWRALWWLKRYWSIFWYRKRDRVRGQAAAVGAARR